MDEVIVPFVHAIRNNMSKRHEKIAFKQIVRLEWMIELALVLAGYSELEIREQLDQYLSTQRQSGGEAKAATKQRMVCRWCYYLAGSGKNLN